MAAIQFRLKRPGKNSMIYLRLSYKDIRLERSTECFILDSKNWSNEKGLPIPRLAENKKLANQLNELRNTIFIRINEDGGNIDSQWLKDEIDYFFGRKSRNGVEESVLYWIKHYWESSEFRNNPQTGGIGLDDQTIRVYKRLYDLFKAFQGRREIKVSEVGQMMATNFLGFLIKDNAHKLSYAKKMVSNLKAVCREAGKHVELAPDFERIKLPADKRQEDPVVLTYDEIQQIIKADIKQAYLQNARKWLLLSCAIGARVSDFLRLTQENITTDKGRKVFKYRETKGGKKKIVYAPIMDLAEHVISSGFPYKISETKLRAYMKEVCRLAGIDTPTEGWIVNPETKRKEFGVYPKWRFVSTHIGRKTFSTYWDGKIPRAAIMRVTGHKSESSFLKYIGRDGHDFSVWDEYDKKLEPSVVNE